MARTLMLLAALAAGLPLNAAAKPPEGKAEQEHYPFFTDAQVRLMTDYYRPGSGHAVPHAPKAGDLPPGIYKKLARGGTLPPGLRKKLAPLPADLARQFPDPPGYAQLMCGDLVLLVQSASELIVDAVSLTRH
jgi:hypothetical protein